MARNINTQLVLLEIAEGLKEFIKNPNLEQSIKDAHALTEFEQNKLNEARKIMENADALLADMVKREDFLKSTQERVLQAEKLEELNQNTLREISRQESILSTENAKNEEVILDISNSLSNLDAKRSELSKYEDALNIRSRELSDYEMRLSKAAAISQEALKAI